MPAKKSKAKKGSPCSIKRGAAARRACQSRVSKCISKKVRGEHWKQGRAVAACLSMERSKRLTASGAYLRVKAKKAAKRGRRNVAT